MLHEKKTALWNLSKQRTRKISSLQTLCAYTGIALPVLRRIQVTYLYDVSVRVICDADR